jgi:hypothetical protein
VIGWFVQRWPVEVTFREVRDHLGFESQRQWSDPAIARTTPCLLGLFSLVALFASPDYAQSLLCLMRSMYGSILGCGARGFARPWNVAVGKGLDDG